MRFLRNWSHRRLLASWLAYWAVLLAVVAGPAIARYWALQRSDAHGSVTLTFESGTLATLLIAGPPLLVAVLWLLSRPRREAPPPPPPEALPRERLDERAIWEQRERAARERREDERAG